jgi:hypothetical protein
MKTLIKNFVLFSFLFLISCHPEKFPGKAMSIKNTSNERIYYWHSGEYSIFHYPDTILPIEKPIFISSCAAKNSDLASGYDPNWNNIYSQLPDGKFTIYFFDELASTQDEWDDIRVNHMVLRKDTTFEELKNNDYIIYYP